MTYRFYKRFLIVFFTLFIPVFMLNEFAGDLVNIVRHFSFWVTIHFSYPTLSIILLYFGIYAHLSGIKTSQKINGPITFIVIGSILTLVSFGPPMVSYFLTHDKIIEPISSAKLQILREGAIDITKKSKDRLLSAELYFIETGRTIEYFDENGERTLYSPSKSVEERRENHTRYTGELRKRTDLAKTSIISLIGIALISTLIFLLFLWHKAKGNKRKGCS